MTRGIKICSKDKQKLYVKFLKIEIAKINLNKEIITNFFESIKNRAKENYFSSLILKYKNNIRKLGMLLKRQ